MREEDIYKAIKNRSIRAGILRTWENLHNAVEQNIERYRFLKEYAKDVKMAKLEVFSDYDRWTEKAMKSIESRNKCSVYYAEDGKEARKIVAEIVGRDKIIVKAKSMVSEEIQLREFLQEIGNEVWETDLGELIVQLANEKPMHVLAPAIHYSERQAAELLRKVGVKGYTAAELAEGVRKFMRQKFLLADVGISGCNAFSAKTGRIFLVENEGNIRLSTTLPKDYIAIVSIDKILPSDELCLKLVILQAAFLGTFPPAYINVNEPVEGQRMHVIFLNNGRKQAPEFLKEQLTCIKCGRCQIECPIFQITGSLWGNVYGGPMGMGWSGILGEIGYECFLSSLCGKCKEVCPMEIDMPRIIRELRKMMVRGNNLGEV
jgi:L-lactate dehydrogenase complex protein LldG